MSIKIGDVEVITQILDSEYRIATLEKLLEFIINNNNSITVLPNPNQILEIRTQVLEQMKLKYPNMGLEIKK